VPARNSQTAALAAAIACDADEWVDTCFPPAPYGSVISHPHEHLRVLLDGWRPAGRPRSDRLRERTAVPHGGRSQSWIRRSGRVLTSRSGSAVWERTIGHGRRPVGRHLVKILFSYTPDALFDADFHRDLLRHPPTSGS